MSELWMKEEKVLTLKDIGGVPGDIVKIDNPELLPICLRAKRTITWDDFKKWLGNRCMPQEREGRKEVEETCKRAEWKDIKNYASLTDEYWIKMRSETWKKINFFTNRYSSGVGDLFFKPWALNSNERFTSDSPDMTTGGILRKRWLQSEDKKSHLVKAGSYATHQEPLSEVLVSVLAEQSGIIPCVKYDLHIEGTTMCSICDSFISIDTDLVTAGDIYYTEEKREDESVYSHLIRMAEKYEIPGAREFIDGMITIDHLTGNEDRNLGNIGFIRDTKTMKFIGPAPLYDSGNAFWNTKKVGEDVRSKLFGNVEDTVFGAVQKKIDFSRFANSEDYAKIIMQYPCITDVKKENLINAIKKRNRRLCLSMDRGNER